MAGTASARRCWQEAAVDSLCLDPCPRFFHQLQMSDISCPPLSSASRCFFSVLCLHAVRAARQLAVAVGCLAGADDAARAAAGGARRAGVHRRLGRSQGLFLAHHPLARTIVGLCHSVLSRWPSSRFRLALPLQSVSRMGHCRFIRRSNLSCSFRWCYSMVQHLRKCHFVGSDSMNCSMLSRRLPPACTLALGC